MNNTAHKHTSTRTKLAGARTALFILYCTFLLTFHAQLFATALLETTAGTATPHTSGDFLAFSIGGYIVRHGKASQLYNLNTQARAQATLLGTKIPEAGGTKSFEGLVLYVYPPFVAGAFASLATLSPTQAYLLWTGINALLLAAAVYGLTTLPGLDARRIRLLAGLAVLAFFPTVTVFVKGQFSFLILALLSATFLSLRRGREGLAGLWLGLGLVKPQLMVAPVIILAYQRRWRALRTFAGVALLLALISVAVVGPAGLLEYIHLLGNVGRATSNDSLVHPMIMMNWRGMITRASALLEGTGGRIPPAGVLGGYALLSVLSLGLLLHAWRRPWPDNRERLAGLWALTIVVGMLVSPHLHIYDLSLWIIVGLLVLAGIRDGGNRGWPVLLMLGHVAPIASLPMVSICARKCTTSLRQ